MSPDSWRIWDSDLGNRRRWCRYRELRWRKSSHRMPSHHGQRRDERDRESEPATGSTDRRWSSEDQRAIRPNFWIRVLSLRALNWGEKLNGEEEKWSTAKEDSTKRRRRWRDRRRRRARTGSQSRKEERKSRVQRGRGIEHEWVREEKVLGYVLPGSDPSRVGSEAGMGSGLKDWAETIWWRKELGQIIRP